jgi:four helix bundle protein
VNGECAAHAKRRAGKDRLHHWRIAAGSAEEVRGSLLIADAWGHIDREGVAPCLELLDRICAMLHRMTHALIPPTR